MSRVCGAVFVIGAAMAAGACAPTTGEGISGCNGSGDCPAAFPICRADLRCWSTADPGVDAALFVDAAVVGIDAAESDTDGGRPPGTDAATLPGTDAATLPGADAAVSPGTDAAIAPGTDAAFPPATDAAVGPGTDAAVAAGSDAGPAGDAGGPCGGGPSTTFYRDLDSDGHGAAASGTMMRCSAGGGYVASNDDCDDGNPTRFPGAAELCNGVDDDCDSTLDGPAASSACVVPGGVGRCDVGICEIASCAAPRADCDGSFATGCETDTSTDPMHCGSCTNECGIVDSCTLSSCALSPWVEVRANRGSGTAVCARRENGLVACWGYNRSGVVRPGVPGAPLSYPPGPVAGVADAVRIAVGQQRACAVTSDGRLQCWPGYSPTTVPGTGTVVDVAISEDSGTTVCAVRASGAVVCFGVSNLFGDGSPLSTTRDTPGPVTGITNALQIASVDNGGFCVLRSDGRVSCWSRQQQMCGTGLGVACPVPATALPTGVVALHDMYGQFCATLGDGTTTCWGNLLLPTTGAPPTGGTALDFWGPRTLGISGVVSGGGSSVVRCVTASGGTSCWGENGVNGWTGRGATTAGALPAAPVAGSFAFSRLGGGGLHMCGISAGSVYCWGSNDVTQLVVTGGSRTAPTLSLAR